MTPIDLLDYTDSPDKISPELLNAAPSGSKVVHPTKVIPAFVLDALAITSGTIFTSIILKLSVTSLMVTPALMEAFDALNFSGLVISIMPLILVSYFFFSFFFNQGQSWGMNVQSIRIEMPDMSFRSSLIWATFCGSALMTCGLSAITLHWLTENKLGDFREHDHLYVSLIEERVINHINLLEQIDSFKAEPQEYFLKAA